MSVGKQVNAKKLLHYPKRSGRKTACGKHLQWDPIESAPDPAKFPFEYGMWERKYLGRSSGNYQTCLEFGQVTCPRCRNSQQFYNDVVEFELLDGSMPWTAWALQFKKGE